MSGHPYTLEIYVDNAQNSIEAVEKFIETAVGRKLRAGDSSIGLDYIRLKFWQPEYAEISYATTLKQIGEAAGPSARCRWLSTFQPSNV